jgi:hypothetical protein
MLEVASRVCSKSGCSTTVRGQKRKQQNGTFEIHGRAQAARRKGDELHRPRSICLSPQCGFASAEKGNILAEHEQRAKLRLIVEIVEETWGWSVWLAWLRAKSRSSPAPGAASAAVSRY